MQKLVLYLFTCFFIGALNAMEDDKKGQSDYNFKPHLGYNAYVNRDTGSRIKPYNCLSNPITPPEKNCDYQNCNRCGRKSKRSTSSISENPTPDQTK